MRTELIEDGISDAGTPIVSGDFRGADEFHRGSGRAEIVELAPGRFELRMREFSVQNGPDLFVYLSPSPDGWDRRAVNLGVLKATDGAFSYALPPEFDARDVGSVVIWCRQFAVQFAHAPLS